MTEDRSGRITIPPSKGTLTEKQFAIAQLCALAVCNLNEQIEYLKVDNVPLKESAKEVHIDLMRLKLPEGTVRNSVDPPWRIGTQREEANRLAQSLIKLNEVHNASDWQYPALKPAMALLANVLTEVGATADMSAIGNLSDYPSLQRIQQRRDRNQPRQQS
ncbi:MAG: hypothetical protein JO323_05405 [Acidobacteriia bacterium]|nr:hypothetical protein [Terriglobia bacterium]